MALKKNFFKPPQSFRGYIHVGITLSVGQSVFAIMYISFYGGTLESMIWPEGVSRFWPKVIWASSKLQEEKVRNLCLLYAILMKKYWKFLLHKKIAYYLRVCHDLDQRSFVQVQGHSKKLQYFSQGLSCNGKWLEALTWLRDYLWPENMAWSWALVINASSRPLGKKWCIHYFQTEKYFSTYIFLAGVSFVSLFTVPLV